MATRTRSKPPRPAPKIAAEFIRVHLGRKAFAPLTGTDWRAWHAFVYLVELWGVSRDPRSLEAMSLTVACAQTWSEDVMQVFVQTIPAMLDWSDVERLWPQIVERIQNSRMAPNLAGMQAQIAAQIEFG